MTFPELGWQDLIVSVVSAILGWLTRTFTKK